MTKNPSTRRSFIQTTGAALSLPLAAAAATVPSIVVAAEDDPIAARLARLEDVEAIRTLNQSFALEANLIATDFGQRDVIDVAPDRRTATALIHGTVEIETAIGPDCPLLEMARQQGGGVVTRSETGVFENAYVKRDGVWTILRSAYRRDA
jgi:hypothetical protein